MPHTYIDHVMHFVFSTKDRRPFLTPERQQLIWPYMGGIAKQNRMKPITIGGVEDHVHMLLAMPSDMDPATAMQYVKGGSSKWFRENHLPEFQWQQGFAGFGGSLENRLRFPLEIFRAMRAIWPQEKPMSVRISATDWVPGGIEGEDSVCIARAFHAAGADIIHVSTGQTSVDAKPVYGRMYQTPYSDRIRNEAGIPTIAVGNITEPDQVNGIIAAGRADICALARPHLADPNWTLHAAAQLGYTDQHWPVQYLTGKQQLERNLRKKEAAQ
jgi:REP element-mobilizing transposase RayT